MTRYDVDRMFFHPDYVHGLLYNDIALVRLKQNAQFNSATKLLCIYPQETYNDEFLVADGDPIKTLPKSECESRLKALPVIKELPDGIINSQFCINECQTRKLAIKDPKIDHAHLAGFLAYCTDPATGTGVYTRLYPFIDWIESVVWPDQHIFA